MGGAGIRDSGFEIREGKAVPCVAFAPDADAFAPTNPDSPIPNPEHSEGVRP